MAKERKLNESLRIGSLLLEFFISFFILMLCSTLAMNNDSFGLFTITHEAFSLNLLHDPLAYLSMAGFILLFCKDCINGQSIAKRILKLQVVDNKTGLAATPMQCFIRNITLLILPLEVITALVRPEERIGDEIAGTSLIIYNPEAQRRSERPLRMYLVPLLCSIILTLLLFFALSKISFNKSEIPFLSNSYNASKSKKLEDTLAVNFAEDYTVSVRYYDSIKNERFDFVSIICQFKSPAIFNNFQESKQILVKTNELIYQIFPKETINGKIQFFYFEKNQMIHTYDVIGTPIK